MSATRAELSPADRTDSILLDVIKTVASVRNLDPLDLPPLTDTVNPDALESIFQPPGRETPNPNGYVSFTYAECAVVVYGDRSIAVEPLTDQQGNRR
ncbi:HalOD1 output domain-containing protein [Haloarchaeobius amylolyticus]|uniref:HalOD1 output domain-containing protein n=1 Tax=Haloarchaeobius amylolyticus TaxID=1198296 RepID=UPI00226F3092|nr:HalOD1 output domain-containing protein [Haloarchaeobius amylolyticus]